MFEWLFHHYGPEQEVLLDTDPRDLNHETARVLLHREPDIPFANPFWNYPLTNARELVYSDRIQHIPLFSSKDQINNSYCAGKLHFTKSLLPHRIAVDPKDQAILTRPYHSGIISASVDSDSKPVPLNSDQPLKVGFRIGGAGPGGPEMHFNTKNSSLLYQQLGPHYIGRKLNDGSLCIEPSSMDAKDVSIHVVNDDIANPPDSLIQTG